MNDFVSSLEETKQLEDLQTLVEKLGPVWWGAESVYLYTRESETDRDTALPLRIEDDCVYIGSSRLELPLVVHDLARAKLPQAISKELQLHNIRSLALLPILTAGRLRGIVELRFTKVFHRWRREEIERLYAGASMIQSQLERIGASALSTNGAAPLLNSDASVETLESRLHFPLGDMNSERIGRLVSFGELLFVATDRNLRIKEILGDTERILGVSPGEMRRDSAIWRRVVHRSDQRKILLAFSRSQMSEIRSEVRVIHQRSGAIRWLMVRAVPRRGPTGVHSGWDGFAIDITHRHENERELQVRQRRLVADLHLPEGVERGEQAVE